MTISTSRQHHEPRELHLHRTDCSYTKSSHVVPMIQDRPSRNRVCSVDSCRPAAGITGYQTILILKWIWTHHVITTAIFLDRHVALWTFFRIGSNPVRCFRVVVTFLYPLSQQATLDRIVPLFTAFETEHVAAFALNRAGINILDLNGIAAVGWRTPAKQAITLYEAVCDQLLVLCTDAGLCQQAHNRYVVHKDITAVSSTSNRFAQAFLHNLCR